MHSTGEFTRKSFVFDIEDAKPPHQNFESLNHQTSTVRLNGMNKQQRSEMASKLQHVKMSKMPNAKNAHGDREFIVKLQPPAGSVLSNPLAPLASSQGISTLPWMCYDGPKRSFQAYIPSNIAGLQEVYALLQRDGVRTENPMFNVPGYKGYFMARWEGSHIRVFYDRVVSPPGW
jgi:hypothetical protein